MQTGTDCATGVDRYAVPLFLCAHPAMQNSIGSASLPSGPRSASILSIWFCGCGLYRVIKKPGCALSFGRDNRWIWRRHILSRGVTIRQQRSRIDRG
jgi:hypothetical protein